MYFIKKKFRVPIGHRLSKHEGLCKNIHGHNFEIEVELGSEKLNKNDMIMDFKDLSKVVNELFLDRLDHGLLLNNDEDHSLYDKLSEKIIYFHADPTAEILSEVIYEVIERYLSQQEPEIRIYQVVVWENNDSAAIYRK